MLDLQQSSITDYFQLRSLEYTKLKSLIGLNTRRMYNN